MAWTTPRTWSAGELVTASMLNTHIRDNMDYLFANIPAGTDLEDLTDVTLTAIASGELLKWNGSIWINNTLAEAGIAAASHVHAGEDITSGTIAVARLSGITRSELAESTGSASASLTSTLYVNITMNVGMFCPSVTGAGGDNWTLLGQGSDGGDDTGRIRLRNQTGGDEIYYVDWRYIDP